MLVRNRLPSLIAVGLLASAAAPLCAACPTGAIWIAFPEDCSGGDTLADAVAAIADGGTIDIAANTYSFGSGGLNLSGLGKEMTLRARSVGSVTFSGGGSSRLARIQNSTSNGKPIVFEGIRFVNGFSATANRAGGVTLVNAEVTFADCSFENNRMTEGTTGGGAIGLYGGSRVLVVRSNFTGNQAKNQGGAIYAVRNADNDPVSVWIHASTFASNSTNVSGFTATAAGGAIYVRNSRLVVSDTRFDDNSAGWVGGAIYAWGDWTGASPSCAYDSSPTTDVLVSRTAFVANRADDSQNPNVQAAQTFGGALHAENCVRARIFGSLFEGNEAGWGGALSSDHAALSVVQTILRHNRALLNDSAPPIGGGIWANANGSTTLPNGSLTLDHVLLRGGTAASPTTSNAQLGGCIYAQGNASTPTRLPVSVTGSIFDRCNVSQLDAGSNLVRGGGIYSRYAAMQIGDSLFIDNDAHAVGAPTGPYGRGAGVALASASTTSLSGFAVFADETSDVPSAFATDWDISVEGSSILAPGAEEWHETPPASAAGVLAAAPSRAPAGSAPFQGESFVGWAFANGSGALDGSILSSTEGIQPVNEGAHQLTVTGLSGCSRCSKSVLPPLEPSTTLDASPLGVATPGDASTLSWTTPNGTLLAALIDRGVGESGSSGSASVYPGSTQTYRRLVVASEGGVLAERTIVVGAVAPTLILADGFESGDLSAWSFAAP